MDEFTKFNNQTAGRDKVFRLMQYCSRIAWYNLEKRGSDPLSVDKAKKLDETLGLMRRLLRFGRFFETLHSALPVMSTINDAVIRLTSTLSRISSACFMAIDHVVCLHKLGLLPKNSIDPARWDKTSIKFWLYSILLGLIRDVYEIIRIYKEEYRPRLLTIKGRSMQAASYENESKKSLQSSRNQALVKCVLKAKVTAKCVVNHADVAIDSLKNFCDLFIPLNALGFVKFSPGTIGFLGIISTIASALPQINPHVKMVPAS